MHFLRVSVSVCAVLLCAVLLHGLLYLRAAPRGGGVPAGNGDVNCDGRIDISDAVHTLVYLFQDGPAPCAAQVAEPCCPEQIQKLEAIAAATEAQAARSAELVEAVKELTAAVAKPRPQDIVNLSGNVTLPAKTEPATFTSIYAVPEGRYLIVTDYRTDVSPIEIFETSGDRVARRTGFPIYFPQSGAVPVNGTHSPTTGLVFSPGTQVSFTNPTVAQQVVNYFLSGRLVDA